ncbi:MAG: tetratricopeptide repeat protein [Acidobacteriia bacterium]|nr:tetratricopeptide repeat protein [Terriglobia bacterium]
MALATGTRLCSYEILGSLGAGGMGEVYKARDTKLGREVAIKIIPEAFAGDTLRLSRFEREARHLAALNHPNVAAIYGLEDCEGMRFLVLEFVPGLTLAEKIAVAPLPVQDALQLASQIAEGLEAAHEKGIVHRDLKPSNIKITPEGKVKVLDFGLAKGTDGEATTDEISESPTLTVEGTSQGTVLGTAAYMSPEQARGKPVDKRTDIWSFGCVVYEMLRGKKAYDGETRSDKIAAILTKDPDWEALPKETPELVRELLQRCMQKDLRNRLRDIGDARMQIEAVLAAPGRADGWLGKHMYQLLGVLLIALMLLVSWVVRKSPPSQRESLPAQKHLVVMPFKDLSGDPHGQLFAEGLAAVVSARLQDVSGVQVMTPAMVQSLSIPETDLPRIVKELGANLILSASVQRMGDQLRVVFSLLSGSRRSQIAGDTVNGSAEDLFALEDRVAQSVVNALQLQVPARTEPVQRTGLETAAAHDHYLQALGYLQRFENESSVDSGIALLKELARTGSDSALVEAGLCRAYLYKYDLSHETSWAQQAINLCQRAEQLDPRMPEVHVTLGLLRTRTGHAVEGITQFQQALSKQPNSADATLGLAEAYEKAGRPSEAETTYDRANQLQPDYWSGYNKLGKFYIERGQYPKALKMFQRVVELSPDNARGYYNLGAALQLVDRMDEARSAYLKAIQLNPTGDAYSNLGTLEFALGRYREAAEAYEKAVALKPGYYLLWANLGDAYRWTQGMQPRAKDAYDKAIQLVTKDLQINAGDAEAYLTLALCLAKTGDLKEAQKNLQRAIDMNPNDPNNLFQAAEVDNLCGKKQEALIWIRRAVEGGYPVADIVRDPELANLRNEGAFREALKTGAKPKSSKEQ